MRMLRLLFFILLFVTVRLWGQPTDLVFKNGKAVTIDSALPQAEAVAISGNKIVFVGSNTEAEKWVGPKTEVVDLQGRLLLPGFNDAHCHLVSGGFSLLRVNLAGVQTLNEIKDKVREAVKRAPKGAWVQGRGWDHTLFNDDQWPTKEMLDVVAPNTPVYLRRIDGHVSWVNSAALKLAKITKDTPDTSGGEIVRDKFGNPTGIFKENATDLVARSIPEPSYEELKQAVERGLEEARRLGVTSLQEASTAAAIPVYNDLFKEGKLTARISAWLPLDTVKYISSYSEVRRSFPSDSSMFKLGILKGFADGTMGSRTAHLFEPYSDDSTTVGIPQYTQEELNRLVLVADSLGFQIGIHAIGDRANYTVLQAYGEAYSLNNGGHEEIEIEEFHRERRHRIEHAQLIRLEDLHFFPETGTIASMQPTHCTSDMRWAEARVGKQRCWGAYAWRSFLDYSIPLAFGTDWPVEPLNPMGGLYAAITRQDLETGEPEGGWYSDHRLSMMEAVQAYTLGSAYAQFREKELGSIAVGKLADLVVLDKDIFSITPRELLSTSVVMTVMDGKIVYRKK